MYQLNQREMTSQVPICFVFAFLAKNTIEDLKYSNYSWELNYFYKVNIK